VSQASKKIYHQNLMNTDFIITVYTSDTEKCDHLVSKVFNEIKLLIKKYSRFDPNSELSQLNKSDSEENEITNEMYNFCNYGIQMGKNTNGIFDITVSDLLNAIGYKKSYQDGMSFEQKSAFEIQEIILNRKTYKDIETHNDNGKFFINKPIGTNLDFGGFLKGYAVDLAWEILNPIENYLIDGGGDVRSKGMANREGRFENWNIGLWNFNNPIEEFISLKSGDCFVCSGANSKKFGEFHHLINPHKIDFQKNYKLTFVYGNHSEINTQMEGLNFKTPTTICDTYATISYIVGNDILNSLPKGIHLIFK